MIDRNETFSFTLIYSDEDTKSILIKNGEIPAITEEDADMVLTSETQEDKETIETIISKIPEFRDAEPGQDPSITETIEDLENKYGFSLEEVNELTDADNAELAPSDGHHAEDMMEKEKEADGEYSLDLLNDPTAIMPEAVSWYTAPRDYMEEEDNYENPLTSPEWVFQEVEELEEGASEGEAISAFVRELQPSKRYYFNEISDLFNKLKIYDREAKAVILRKLPMTGNVEIIKDEDGVPCIIRKTNGMAGENFKADEHLISALINPANIPTKGAKSFLRPNILRH